MATTLGQVQAVVERLWPAGGSEPWDAVGLIAGDPATEVSSILLAVDAVVEVADEAAAVDLLLVHHPLLLRGVTSISEDTYKGAVLGRLLRSGTALLAAHTNADVVESGTSAVLAASLDLLQPEPIVPGAIRGHGIGRVGDLAAPMTLGRLATALATLLPPTAGGVRVSGEYDALVSRVAVCGGAGDSLLAEPAVTSADVYITSDLRHHPASEARENARLAGGPALIDISHWASEWLWLETAAAQLRSALPNVTVAVSEIRTDPWDFTVVQ
jgi:dinuclear metal center YbgI/SA1388 family protein